MSLDRKITTKTSSDSDYQSLEAGEYDARLVYVADLGVHQDEYKGEVKNPAQKIALGLEIVGKTITIDGEEKPRYLWTRPFNIFSTLTPKGNELKFYSVFDSSATEGDVPDWDAQIGKACSLIMNQNDKGYDNITTIVAIPSKYQDDIKPATLEGGVGTSDSVINALFGLTRWAYDNRLQD